eukprot:TRINITY_DN7604_c1_g1_i2.p1 TRINITY_DN7604_c1_g1~~TRINITY_DN7604_c1_g1_i2.p1  ORF type:complete len:1205 (+),score=448.14 TRINITY_DN7604_c1_g1_i2:27-3617(+)
MSRVSSHEEGPTRLVLSGDGEEVYTGGVDATVNVFEFNMVFKGQKWVRQYDGNSEQIMCISMDRDTGRFAVGAQDGIVNLYEPGKPPRVIFRQAACIIHACPFSPDGTQIAVACDNGLRVVPTVEGAADTIEITAPLDRGEAVLAASWMSSNVLVCGATSGVHAWDLSTGKPEHKKYSKDHKLTQPRQRNETVNLTIPETTIMGTAAFVYPKGKGIVVQPVVKGSPVTITIPDLEGSHEVYLVASRRGSEIVAALDDLGYLTIIDLTSMKVLSRMRPLLFSEEEGITDMVWHPTEPTAVLVATTSGSVQMLCGVYDVPEEKPKKTKEKKPAKEKKEKKEKPAIPKEHLDDSDGSGSESDDVGAKKKKKRRSMFVDDQAEEGDDSEDAEDELPVMPEEPQENEADQDMDMEIDEASVPCNADSVSISSSEGGKPIRIRTRQAPFQVGQTPPPGHPGVEGAKILCWNKIGYVRCTTVENTSHVVVNFYDKAKYSTLRFTDHKTAVPLTIASLGRHGVLLASSSQSTEHSNRLTYRSVISWGTNPDWTHTLTNEVPQTLALGDLWAVCFTDQYMRVFRHSGIATMVIALPHRVICSIGMEASMTPVCGDIPLQFAPQDTIAYAYDDGVNVACNVWNLSTKTAVQSGVVVPMAKDSSLMWMGWADEGMLAVQDSNQVVKVLTHNFGTSWVPVYDPKANQTFERLHVLNIRGGILSGVVVAHGVGPDPRVDEHDVVRRQLAVPVLTDRPAPWPEKEGANVYTSMLLDEKKSRAQCYTADLAKLEVKQDSLLATLFKETLNSTNASTTRALDIAMMFNMKDHLEAAMQLAYNQNEEKLYGKMRRVFESEFSKRTRRNRLPDKPKQNKEEKLTSWVKQLRQTEKDLRARLEAAETQASQADIQNDVEPMTPPTETGLDTPDESNTPAPVIAKNAFFAPIQPVANEPLDALGGLRYMSTPNEQPSLHVPVSTTPTKPHVIANTPKVTASSSKKRKAESAAPAEKKPRKEKKEPKKVVEKPKEKKVSKKGEVEEKEKEQDWWEVDGRHADDIDKPVDEGLMESTQCSVGGFKPLPTPSFCQPVVTEASAPASLPNSVLAPISQPDVVSAPAPPAPEPVPAPAAPVAPSPEPKNNGMSKLLALRHQKKPEAPKYASGGLKEVVLPEKKEKALPTISSNLEKARLAAQRVAADDSESDEEMQITIKK